MNHIAHNLVQAHVFQPPLMTAHYPPIYPNQLYPYVIPNVHHDVVPNNFVYNHGNQTGYFINNKR